MGLSVVVAKTTTLVACTIAGTFAIADQLINEGDITDPLEIIDDTATEGMFATLDALGSGFSTKTKFAKAGAVLSEATYEVLPNIFDDISN